MGLHIYCVVSGDHQPTAGLTGCDGALVRAADHGGVGVWYSEHEQPPAAEPAALRAHNAVVEAGMTEDATPVPVRFGQWFESVPAVLGHLTADAPKWLDLLHRFAGCVEYGVHIAATAQPQPARDVHRAGGSGTQYMAALARSHAETEQRRAEGEAIATRVHAVLADIVVAVRTDFPVGALVNLAHLVARAREGDYHAVLEEFRRSRSDLRFRTSGPWPPYSFVA